MIFVVRPPGIVYEGETDAEAAEIDRRIAEHNAAVEREMDAWKPAPMTGLRAGWDCGCPALHEHHGCANTACPRL